MVMRHYIMQVSLRETLAYKALKYYQTVSHYKSRSRILPHQALEAFVERPTESARLHIREQAEQAQQQERFAAVLCVRL